MRIEETLRLAADAARVWELVSDCGAVLALVPGVADIEQLDEASWRCRMRQKVGFVEAEFDVRVVTVHAEPPRLLRVRAEGRGVQIPATVVTTDEVRVRPVGRETEVTYVSEVQLSGGLAALGHAAMKIKARQLIDEFRRRVVQALEG